MSKNLTRRQALALPAGIALGSLVGRPAKAAEPVKIGLVAALSGQSAKSGEGITRGLTIAIDEINARGGVLGGRMLELVRRDDKSNPAKGQTAARELIDKEGAAILFGGIDSPVSLAIVPVVNEAKVPSWAYGPPRPISPATAPIRTMCFGSRRSTFWSTAP